MSADFTPVFKDYSGIKPFKFWCQKVLPLAYDDSLSYYEVLCKIKEYLNNTIDDVADLEDNLGDLYDAFVALQAWVNDYFENLDLTEELTPIVQEELDQVLGDITYDSNTKTAVMVPGSGTLMPDNVENIQILNKYPVADASAREWIDGFNFTPKRMYKKAIFIGDSYLDGWTPEGMVTSWGAYLAGYLDLTVNTSAFIYSQGGAGFGATSNDRNFVTMLNEAIVDSRFDNDDIDLIVVGGGYNDQFISSADIATRMNTFGILAKTNFPNARVYVVDMGWSQLVTTSNSTVYTKTKVLNSYYNGAADNNLIPFVDCWKALIGVGYSDEALLASDGIHPKDYGEQRIARAIYGYITGGQSVVADHVARILGISALFAKFDGSSMKVFMTNFATIENSYWNNTSGVCDGNATYAELPKIAGFSPVTDNKFWGSAEVLVRDNSGFKIMPAVVGIIGGHIRLYPVAINSAGNNYLSVDGISYCRIQNIAMTVPAIWC